MSEFLSSEEILSLKALHKIANRREADKIKAVLMLNSDYSPDFIAEVLLTDDSTIYRWIKT